MSATAASGRSDGLVRVEDRDAVRVLTLNRPQKRNALDTALTQALLDALHAADADDAIRCVLLTGAGPAFCAGADLAEFREPSEDRDARLDHRAQLMIRLNAAFPSLSKPVVSAINGPALGGGAGLAVACDLAVMAESATLGYPETKHGIVATFVMANLVRQVGRKLAFELAALGEPIGALKAAAVGLVNRVVADERLMDEALKLAARLAALDRRAMAGTKALFHESADLPLADALGRGLDLNRRMRR